MKYSKATNYALHTILFLAKATPNKLVSVHQLAEMQNVSPTYLSKILTKLTKEGMIHSSSGPKGGYSLSKNWEDISFLDIIHAIEGKTSLFECCLHDKPGCLINEVMLAKRRENGRRVKKSKNRRSCEKIKVDF